MVFPTRRTGAYVLAALLAQQAVFLEAGNTGSGMFKATLWLTCLTAIRSLTGAPGGSTALAAAAPLPGAGDSAAPTPLGQLKARHPRQDCPVREFQDDLPTHCKPSPVERLSDEEAEQEGERISRSLGDEATSEQYQLAAERIVWDLDDCLCRAVNGYDPAGGPGQDAILLDRLIATKHLRTTLGNAIRERQAAREKGFEKMKEDPRLWKEVSFEEWAMMGKSMEEADIPDVGVPYPLRRDDLERQIALLEGAREAYDGPVISLMKELKKKVAKKESGKRDRKEEGRRQSGPGGTRQ